MPLFVLSYAASSRMRKAEFSFLTVEVTLRSRSIAREEVFTTVASLPYLQRSQTMSPVVSRLDQASIVHKGLERLELFVLAHCCLLALAGSDLVEGCFGRIRCKHHISLEGHLASEAGRQQPFLLGELSLGFVAVLVGLLFLRVAVLVDLPFLQVAVLVDLLFLRVAVLGETILLGLACAVLSTTASVKLVRGKKKNEKWETAPSTKVQIWCHDILLSS